MAYDAADFSVVIPVGNGAGLLRHVVGAVLAATPPPGEVIIVDDGVTDDSLKNIRGLGNVRVIRNDGGRGPAGARNAGARAARRSLLVFLDADVLVGPATFAALAAAYENYERVDGVVAVQAVCSDLPNVASRYKNLWMRYTYIRLPSFVDLFYTTCASIKKDVFFAVGGLDENYRTPSVEDTAFGRLLARRGVRIAVAKEVEVEHRKSYTTRGLIKTTFERGSALTRCVLRTRGAAAGNRTSVPTPSVVGVALAGAWPVWLMVFFFSPWLALAGAAANLCGLYAASAGWLAFLVRNDAAAAAWAIWFLPVELAAAFAGGVWGLVGFWFLRRRY